METAQSPFDDPINALIYTKAKLNDKIESLIADAKSDDTQTFDFDDAVEDIRMELANTVEEIDSINEQFN